jgi:hypothetical protein
VKYQCTNRFVSSLRYHYRIGDIISQDGYDRLTNTEKNFFTKVPESFADQLADNIKEDETEENKDI